MPRCGLTNFDLTEEGLRTMMNQRYGPKAEAMLALYRNRYPDKSPFLIQAQIVTDSTARKSAMLQAERKSAQGQAPAYMYLWAFASAGFGGKFGAVHGTDVSATFNNYRDGVGGTGSEEERALWARFATTWVTMAKNANPNNSKIPTLAGLRRANARDHGLRQRSPGGKRSAQRDPQILGRHARRLAIRMPAYSSGQPT